MIPDTAIRSVAVDFDGTICAEDVSDAILLEFAGPATLELDREYEQGLIGSRENVARLAELVRGGREEIIEWTLDRFAVEPSFPPFVAWAASAGLRLVVVSDGIGAHIEPLLRRAGVGGVEVVTNEAAFDGGRLAVGFPNGHAVCRTCGTCKMLAVTRLREDGPVAYVGDGHSDRYGALYSDLVFAKGHLAAICREEAIPFAAWAGFDDVRAGLETARSATPVAPEICPGWSLA